FHGAVTAGVGPGTIVYIAGAGPVGLASAASCHLLGAACVIVGDMIPERLAQARWPIYILTIISLVVVRLVVSHWAN
ncbi:MAG: hypothetical protein ACKO4S_08425, partial [Snowella sp.]